MNIEKTVTLKIGGIKFRGIVIPYMSDEVITDKFVFSTKLVSTEEFYNYYTLQENISRQTFCPSHQAGEACLNFPERIYVKITSCHY